MAVDFKRLNGRILNHIEAELAVLKTNYPELAKALQDSYTRIRKNVLDCVGEVQRSSKNADNL